MCGKATQALRSDTKGFRFRRTMPCAERTILVGARCTDNSYIPQRSVVRDIALYLARGSGDQLETREVRWKMAVDWVFAAEVGAAGMALTFIALSCLAVALWLAELALRRIGTRKDMTEEKKEVS